MNEQCNFTPKEMGAILARVDAGRSVGKIGALKKDSKHKDGISSLLNKGVFDTDGVLSIVMPSILLCECLNLSAIQTEPWQTALDQIIARRKLPSTRPC